MSRKTRRWFVIVLTVVFIGLGTGMVFYSLGWRVDFGNLEITKTGAIFVRSFPKDTIVSIDGKTAERSDGFVFSGTLKKGLVPKDYKVTVEAEGFKTWENQLTVRAEIVTEIKDIVLAPKETETTAVASTTGGFYRFNDSFIRRDRGGYLIWGEQKLTGNDFISGDEQENIIITKNNQGVFFLNNLNEKSILNLNLVFKNLKQRAEIRETTAIKNIISGSGHKGIIIVVTGAATYAADINKLSLTIIDEQPIKFSYWRDREILMANGRAIRRVNIDSGEGILVTELKEESEIIKADFGEGEEIIVLQANGSLTLITKGEQKQIAHSVIEFIRSPDQKRVVFRERDQKISFYSIPKDKYQKSKKTETEKAGEIIMVSQNHLLLNYGDRIVILQAAPDTMDGEEAVLYQEEIYRGQTEKMEWDKNKEELFIETEGEIKRIDYFKGAF